MAKQTTGNKQKKPASKPKRWPPVAKTLTEDSPLTRRQELFVREIVAKDGQITKYEAAVNAGYAPSSAHVRANELLNPRKCPHVVAAIKRYRDDLDARYGITYQRHLRDLQVIRDAALANGNYSAAVAAEYRRGQAHGDIYVSKSEIRHGTIDNMSKDDVLKELEALKKQLGENVIDVTPSEPPASHEDDSDGREQERGRILARHEEVSKRLAEIEDAELDADED